MTKLDEKPPDHEFSTKPKKNKLNGRGQAVLRASRRFAPHQHTGIAVLHGLSLPSRRVIERSYPRGLIRYSDSLFPLFDTHFKSPTLP